MTRLLDIARSRTAPAVLASLAFVLAFVLAAVPAAATETSVQAQSGDDLYAAGVSVQVPQPVAGDAVLAGGSVLITQDVGQDVLAAGGSITLTHTVEDDVRAAGGSITITDRVGGDALLAGGTVTLAPGSRVAGNAWLAGGVLHLAGTVNGNVRAAGGEVVLSGRVDGDSRILADTLEIASSAIIHGTVRYEGPRPPRVAGGAQVGKIVYTERHFKGHGLPWAGGLIASFVIFLSLAVSTLIFAWLFPNASREAVRNASERMFLSLGVGLLAVLVIPFIAAALFALLLTTPLGVILVAAMVVLLATGCFVAVACLGSWIRTRLLPGPSGRAWFYPVSVLAGALVYWLVALIPFVGVLIVLLAFATGAGGLILLAARLYKQTDRS